MSNLIERYVFQVGRYLPVDQRDDILLELKTTLYDMAGENPTEEEISEILKDFGSPRQVAAKYNPHIQYLVGPMLYPIYVRVLSIVLLVVTIGISVSYMISFAVSEAPAGSILLQLLSTLYSSLIMVFGYITIVFALIQRFQKDIFSQKDIADFTTRWDPAQLPQVPSEKAAISPFKIIGGLIFSTIILLALILFPERISFIFFSNGEYSTTVPILNISHLQTFIPYFAVALIYQVVHSLYLLRKGAWDLISRLGKIIFEIYTSVIFILFILSGRVISEEFFAQITAYSEDLAEPLSLAFSITKVFIIVGILVSAVSEVYKQVRAF